MTHQDPMPFERLQAPSVEELNQVIPHYTILELIAIGVTGAVYKAKHNNTDQQVAIKVFPRRYASDEFIYRAMRKRAKSLMKLQHQNLASIFAFDQAGGTPYLVMEYAEGSDLRFLIMNDKPLSPERAGSAILQICSGMSYAHKKKVIHHDLRPKHIVINEDGGIKIIDFELIPYSLKRERFTEKNPNSEGFESPHLAENFEHKKAYRSDIYSIGALLSFLTSGHTPDHLRILSTLEKSIPAEFLPIVEKAVSLELKEQYKSLSHCFKELTPAIQKLLGVETKSSLFINKQAKGTGWALPKVSNETTLDSFKNELGEAMQPDSNNEIIFNERYKLESLIRSRRIGLLYKAWDLKIGCYQALTLQMHAQSSLFTQPLKMLCENWVQLQHPNIPQMSDYGFHESGIFLVQQLIQGVTLRQVMQTNQYLDFRTIHDITSQLLDALCAGVHYGFFNHSLSLDSIMVQEQVPGKIRVYVTDTGHGRIAQLLCTVDQVMTQQRLQNPELIPPEFRYSGLQNEYSSIYILGSIIYYMALGGHPYSHLSIEEVYAAHLNQQLPSIASYRPDIPPEFSQWVETCMAIPLESRYSSIEQATQCFPPVTLLQ